MLKAFDRVKWPQLFVALEVQGVSRPYLAPPAEIYGGHKDNLKDQRLVEIQRDVGQGDVLRPLLFNDARESDVKGWSNR